MNNNTTYKDSPLGKIPSDWEVRELGGVINQLTNGLTYDPDSNSGFPITRIETIADGNINIEKTGLTPYFDSYEKFKLKKGEILYSHINSVAHIGKVAYCENDFEILHGMNLLRLIPKSTVDSKYLYYLLNSKYGNRHAYSSAKRAVNQASLSTNEIKKFKFPFAPLPEQARIAELLGTWDKAITNLQATITQKELRNKWLMQQLLTGKKRLKGFGGEWMEVRMKDLFKRIDKVNDGDHKHSVMTISAKQGLVSQEDKFDRVIAGDSLKKYTLLNKNDFAYNKGNSKTYQMGCIYQLEEIESALVPFVYICFSPTEKIYSAFYKHWFLAHGLDRQLNRIITSGARGDGLLNVNSDDFFKLKVPYPTIEEQTAIANVLQTASNEVQLLQKQLDKLREQKKGLMQVLLTGKKRLKVNSQI